MASRPDPNVGLGSRVSLPHQGSQVCWKGRGFNAELPAFMQACQGREFCWKVMALNAELPCVPSQVYEM